jgi:hypothetical protein
MKIIKRVSLSIIAITIIVGIVLVLLKMREEQRMLEVVKSGQVVIDQVIRDWNVCTGNVPVKIQLYVRNNVDHKITGNLVFLVTLSRKGLEEKFIREVINCDGEERLKREMAEEIAQKGSIGRAEGIYNYLLRGKKLLPGQKYEPYTKIADKDYSFRFRQQIFLNPGELIKIDHEEQIPFNERGNLLSVKIENIEF